MLSQNFLWAIGLMLLAGVFLIAEFLIPSAGLLGIGAAIAAIAALVLAYSDSTAAGLTMTGVFIIGTPILLMTAIRVWPYTPIGRRILNLPPLEDEDYSPNAETGSRERRFAGLWKPENPYQDLLGKVGVAKTNLLPSGQVEIDGRKYDAVAIGTAVDRGQFVEVSSVDAGRIRVKLTSRRPVEDSGTDDLAASPAEFDDDAETELINRPLDDFDIEDLADPLK